MFVNVLQSQLFLFQDPHYEEKQKPSDKSTVALLPLDESETTAAEVHAAPLQPTVEETEYHQAERGSPLTDTPHFSVSIQLPYPVLHTEVGCPVL